MNCVAGCRPGVLLPHRAAPDGGTPPSHAHSLGDRRRRRCRLRRHHGLADSQHRTRRGGDDQQQRLRTSSRARSGAGRPSPRSDPRLSP